jgi:hypothetical protein
MLQTSLCYQRHRQRKSSGLSSWSLAWNHTTFIFNTTASFICILYELLSFASQINLSTFFTHGFGRLHTFPTLLRLKDRKQNKGNKSPEKPFLTTYNLEECRAFILFMKLYLLRPIVCLPPKLVFLAFWPGCLPTLLNLSGTTCSIYDFPGKFLLSLGSARNCGNQYATYSPSGSYVCACNSRSILGVHNMFVWWSRIFVPFPCPIQILSPIFLKKAKLVQHYIFSIQIKRKLDGAAWVE